jgi:hypothetical protein
MEDILDLYQATPAADTVYLAIDEKGKELQKEVRETVPMQEGQVKRYDSEYQRQGSCNLFVAYNWHTHQRHILVSERRRGEDWGQFLGYLAEQVYPSAKRIVVVCDNLNIHDTASLYEVYEAERARAIAKRIEFHYTPVHASWLNMAEIELSALERQCLGRRLGEVAEVAKQAAAYEQARNAKGIGIKWQFSTEQARVKLGRAYPSGEGKRVSGGVVENEVQLTLF